MPEFIKDQPMLAYILVFFIVAALTEFRLFYRHIRKLNTRLQETNKQVEEHTRENERLKFENRKLLKQKLKNEDLLKSLQQNDPKGNNNKRKIETSRYDMVTVLFADIQGFTRIAEEMNPDFLIDQLDKLFFYFDLIIEKYQVEKIKTIGDAYMCAGGLPAKNRTNPVEVILVGLEMQHYLNRLHSNKQNTNTNIWDLRIGVHTGAVIAGAIGKKKISYDIWGDTVNIASRMESSGAIGKVNISASTYHLIKDFFVCPYRGKMPIKYKGDVDMYFVEGIKPDLSIDRKGNEPNEKFLIKLALLQTEDIKDHIVERMKNDHNSVMRFHNYQRVNRIAKQAELLAEGEKLNDLNTLLIKTSAIFILSGYMFTTQNVKEASINYMKELLPEYEYKHEQTEKISQLIQDFYNGAPPQDIKSGILRDAYYEYLGSFNFIDTATELFKELKAMNKATNYKTYWHSQIKLLNNYDFYCDTARAMRDVEASEQISKISRLLKDMEKITHS